MFIPKGGLMLNDIMEKFKQQYGNYNKANLTLYTDCSSVLRSFFETSNGIEEKDIFSFNSLEQLKFFFGL